jgi:antitoxin ParD1/3/4
MSTSINISLPAPMKKWAEQEAVKRGYGTTDAFFVEMLRREKKARTIDRIDDLLEEAMSEGEPTPMTRADWDRIRARGRALVKARRRK